MWSLLNHIPHNSKKGPIRFCCAAMCAHLWVTSGVVDAKAQSVDTVTGAACCRLSCQLHKQGPKGTPPEARDLNMWIYISKKSCSLSTSVGLTQKVSVLGEETEECVGGGWWQRRRPPIQLRPRIFSHYQCDQHWGKLFTPERSLLGPLFTQNWEPPLSHLLRYSDLKYFSTISLVTPIPCSIVEPHVSPVMLSPCDQGQQWHSYAWSKRMLHPTHNTINAGPVSPGRSSCNERCQDSRVLIMQLFIVVSSQNCKDCSRLLCFAALTCSHLVIVGLGNSWYCDALVLSVSVMVMMSNSRHKVCCQHALFLNICDH